MHLFIRGLDDMERRIAEFYTLVAISCGAVRVHAPHRRVGARVHRFVQGGVTSFGDHSAVPGVALALRWVIVDGRVPRRFLLMFTPLAVSPTVGGRRDRRYLVREAEKGSPQRRGVTGGVGEGLGLAIETRRHR